MAKTYSPMTGLGDRDPRGPVKSYAYRATACVRCLPTALIHFFFVESRSVLMVWVTGYLTAIQAEELSPTKFKVVHSAWKFDTVPGMLNLIVLLYVIVFILINMVFLVKKCGVCASFEDGKYLAYSYDLELAKRYKIMVYILLVLIWGVMVRFYIYTRFEATEDKQMASLYEFAANYGMNFLTVVGLTAALLNNQAKRTKRKCCQCIPNITHIDWTTNTFQEIKFTRTITDLFAQTNDAFAAELTEACWQAKSGHYEDLWNLVSDQDLEKALQIRARPEITEPAESESESEV